MLVSIITPAYNAVRVLPETVESIIAQSFTDWELILVDDGSTDETFALCNQLAARDSRIRALTRANGGVAAARNSGITAMSPESVAVIFIDHDDLWAPDALETLWSALQNNPKVVGAHGLPLLVETEAEGRAFRDDPTALGAWRRKKLTRGFGFTRVCEADNFEPTTFEMQIYNGCAAAPGVMLVRRSALDKIGNFDSEVVPCDDWDMWIRLSVLGDVAYVRKIVLNWCIYGGNSSLNSEKMGWGVSQVRRKAFKIEGLSKYQRSLAIYRYRREYASVERQNAKDTYRWACDALRRQDLRNAWSYYSESFRRQLLYLQLRHFWGPSDDRGPIPSRLKDHLEPLSFARDRNSKGYDQATRFNSDTLL